MTKHHISCIPHSYTGILAWGHNINSKSPGYDQKYEISETLGENCLTDLKACYNQFAELLGNRGLIQQYLQDLTGNIRLMLEGEKQDILIAGVGQLDPAGQYRVMGGLLLSYAGLVHHIKNHPNYSEADGIDLGFYPPKGHGDTDKVQSHVTPHRSDTETTLNCTKPGGADSIGVEYDHDDGTGWHPLGPGAGTNAQWKDPFISPARPVTLLYRITLYKRGHAIGQKTIVSISSQP